MAKRMLTAEENGRYNVYREIIDAEESYIKAMEYVLYYETELENRTVKPVLSLFASPLIKNQVHVLFANLKDIYNFHSEILLPELLKCEDNPVSVAHIFMRNSRNFVKLYSPYIQNHQAQTALAIEIGNHEYFTECDKKRDSKPTGLPYSSYLLYPVQRIGGKYGLLIKEMLKNTTTEEDEKILEDCLKTLKSIATTVNGVSFSPLILNYPRNLYQEGEFLLSGKFSVIYKRKNERRSLCQKLKDIIKPKKRLLCFYDECLIFCKERRPSNPDTGKIYEFKNRFQFSHFGITQNIRDRPKKFKLWSDGRQHVYIMKAKNVPMKHHWVNAIRTRLCCRNHIYEESSNEFDSDDVNVI